MEKTTAIIDDFSPILIMEFIRQVAVARFLNEEKTCEKVQFKISKSYYDELTAYPLQVQFIGLSAVYDEGTEVLTVIPSEETIDFFKAHKSMVEIACQYEETYANRYKPYIEVISI